jgi:FkbM family methyltransferase
VKKIEMSIDPVFEILWPMLAEIEHRRPSIIEIGVHHGTSTRWFHAAAQLPIHYLGFEPDPRNREVLREAGILTQEVAVSDRHNMTKLYLSGGITPGTESREHTDSSSIVAPTKHLEAHPWCTFDDWARVVTAPPDSYLISFLGSPNGVVDLIWADVQGAQRQVIAGGQLMLSRTRYLYIEVHPEPMYEGEPTFEELCELLPYWEVVQRYPADVLFANKKMWGIR